MCRPGWGRIEFVLRFKLAPTESVIQSLTISDNIVAGTHDLIAIQNPVPLHKIAAVRAKSIFRNLQRGVILHYLPLGQLCRLSRMFQWLGFILGMIAILEPLGGF
jgi:hypothetical protein